jgi:3-deoxy-D-manno-octulosonate 8-phosphate phosphatase (KDO 8-P phosphatase)
MDTIFREKARRIQMLLMDVDGVLTDGTFQYGEESETKRFHSRDGIGIVLAKRAGLKVGLISGRESAAVAARARQLKVDFLKLGVIDKAPALEEALDQEGLTAEQVVFIGDDLPDLPILLRVGLSIAVADAHEEVRTRVDYVTRARGGYGAVREAVDQILLAKGLLEDLVKKYLST